jgi:hypothetical protein
MGFLPAAQAQTPAKLFAADASGMLKFDVSCKAGEQYGSGFLLGPRLVMTARHVLVDGSGKSCPATVVQEGTHARARIVRWMAIRDKAAKAPTDLAIAVLDAPLTGYDFSIAASAPRVGELVIALGYGLAQPLSLNQGHIRKLLTSHHVRLLTMLLSQQHGASGGPILDASGQVIGVGQYGVFGLAESVDLARLVHGNPDQLCFGVAAGETGTICAGRKPATELLDRDGRPAACVGGFAADLPFSACPPPSTGPGLDTSVVRVVSQCPTSGEIEGDGFLLGARLMMTAEHLLFDANTGASCTTTVNAAFGGSSRVKRWMGVQVTGSHGSTDIAIAVLGSSLTGHYLSLSSTPPPTGAHAHVFDFLHQELGGSSSVKVVHRLVESGVQVLEVKGATNDVTGGDPIVNAKGNVVGLVQFGRQDDAFSVDIPRLTGGDATQFCVGDAAGQPSTVCSGHPPSASVLSRDRAPRICGGLAAVGPFTVCQGDTSEAPVNLLDPAQSGGPTQTTTTTPTLVRPTFTDCWVTTSRSFDPSQRASTISDSNRIVYFVAALSGPASPVTAAMLDVTEPNGVSSSHFNGFLAMLGSQAVSGSTYQLVTTFTGSTSVAPPDGVWKFTLTLPQSEGATCSASVTVGP